MENSLSLSTSCSFYKLGSKKLSNAAIKRIYPEITKKKSGNLRNYKIREVKEIDGKKVLYSFAYFKVEEPPTFFSESNLIETKYGYCLLIEYENYVFVNGRHISNMKSELESYAVPVDYSVITQFLIDDKTSILKLNTTNTDISKLAIRKRTMEAKDLSKSYMPISSSKQILRNVGINKDTKKINISTSNARLTEMSSKVDLVGISQWGIAMINQIIAFEPRDNYLSSFAKPISLEEKEKSLIPSAILFDLNELENIYSEITQFTFESKGKITGIPLTTLPEILNVTSNVLSIEKNILGEFRIVTNLINDIKVKIFSKSIKVQSKKLAKMYLYFENGEKVSLISLINKMLDFTLTFTDPLLAYSAGVLFEDTQLIKNTKTFTDTFVVFDELDLTTSEKGVSSSSATEFPPNTQFSFIDNNLRSDCDYLFCDDMGFECADFISVKENNEINFYHAKSNPKANFSASAFHIVVSQALKNLPNICNVDNMNLPQKASKWGGKFKKTKINMLRKKPASGDAEKGVEMLSMTSANQTSINKVWLVVDFISKKQLIEQLETPTSKELSQLIWLLSSFVSECKEAGALPYIACKK